MSDFEIVDWVKMIYFLIAAGTAIAMLESAPKHVKEYKKFFICFMFGLVWPSLLVYLHLKDKEQ